MLMGDFNFSDGWTEQRKLDKCFVDVWRELNPLPSGKEECKDDPAQGAACLAAVTRFQCTSPHPRARLHYAEECDVASVEARSYHAALLVVETREH